jgi:very-short-patch-repair endonuclease
MRDMKKQPAPGAHARARTLRRNMTEAERQIWQILRSEQMQGHKFRRQVPIGRYIADFVCHEARLVIEIDGGQHDPSSGREVERSAFLQDEGYCVLRFWNNEALSNIEGVYATIAAALCRTPSPLMGEGRGGGEASVSLAAPRSRVADITPTQTLPHQGGGLPCSGTRR